MAYDGLVIRAQLNEIKSIVLNERISKISQKNNKNVSLLFRKNSNDINFSININPNFPHLLIENEKPKTFQNPYSFTMILRKYLEGGIITDIKQIDGKNNEDSLERIVEIDIKNTIETGDTNNYKLIIELLGRYSNILLTDNNKTIIDVLYKINENDKSLRVLKPKNEYSTNELYDKIDLINSNFTLFENAIYNTYTQKMLNKENINICNLFLQSFYGISKTFILSILYKLRIDEKEILNIITTNNKNSIKLKQIYDEIKTNINDILNNKYNPTVYFENNKIKDFHILPLNIYTEKNINFKNINEMLKFYIENKFTKDALNEKSHFLKEKIQKLIEKTIKKIDINELEINNSKNFNEDKIIADLIQTFGYDKNNIKSNILYCKNYYDNDKNIEIKLDENLSIQKNAEKYYSLYNKKKRTIEKSTFQLNILNNELEHLNNLSDTLKYLNDIEDIIQVENELNTTFKLKNQNKTNSKKIKKISINISHYRTDDGLDVYVGKNNVQNEYVTFNIASPNDTWLHIKNATGSHVIVKNNYEDIDIKTLEKIASLAAYFSSKKNENKVEVDYTLKKELKKVKNKPMGFVIYHKNYSINVTPGIFLKEVK